jgi:HD-like signal output (HDOD) protein/CheY-like chemotaxis protein
MNRLLFVDDEPRVLAALRQSLYGKRKIWEMVFSEGAEEALRNLSQGRFDVVITDMRMPGMDGAELLRQAALLQPETWRVVLSGQMDEAAAVRAAAFAHRYIAKPCGTDNLVAILSAALERRAWLQSPELRHCIGGMTTLASSPAVCRSLQRALEDEQCTLSEIKKVVESDVGLYARVLQLVNSGFFGSAQRIVNMTQALNYLSLNTMRGLLAADALFRASTPSDAEHAAASQGVARVAADYAESFALPRRLIDVAVTAALLHNVGALALGAHGSVGPSAAPEATAYLLGLWGLPDEVIDSVNSLQRPWDSFSHLDAAAVTRLAVHLAHRVVEAGAPKEAPVGPEVLDRLAVIDTVAAILARTEGPITASCQPTN